MTSLKNEFVLTIPGNPKYLSVVRLAVSGLASRLQFSYEDVEDIKLAVAEACAHAISHGQGQEITIECQVSDTALSFSIKDKGTEPLDEEDLGLFLIRSLMDDVRIEMQNGSESRLRMKKAFSAVS